MQVEYNTEKSLRNSTEGLPTTEMDDSHGHITPKSNQWSSSIKYTLTLRAIKDPVFGHVRALS